MSSLSPSDSDSSILIRSDLTSSRVSGVGYAWLTHEVSELLLLLLLPLSTHSHITQAMRNSVKFKWR
jgi:hypothetical protein